MDVYPSTDAASAVSIMTSKFDLNKKMYTDLNRTLERELRIFLTFDCNGSHAEVTQKTKLQNDLEKYVSHMRKNLWNAIGPLSIFLLVDDLRKI